MHLKQLKLAGFKSFVDPTVIPVPSQLVAVVGPNGCGKSNVIDAVRWVLGESFAKHLRGETLTDVIFKGSSHRKAVGQASVELLFDNSFGRLTGQYASYQEIAIKRIVTHDGDSAYFLNGSRCRRRDIVELLLGTGASARGYAIIGQDTISRLIEAHPEDLRVYFEEAAGVSKYKERRRETRLRMQHTAENLARVADIRDELAKQLTRLERQAQAAERYSALKQAARQCRAEILALKWRQLDAELQQLQHQHRDLVEQQGTWQTQSALAWQEAEQSRIQWQLTQREQQALQTQFYQCATELARLEEILQQRQQEQQRLQQEQQQLEQEDSAAQVQIKTLQNQLQSNQLMLAQLQEKKHQSEQQQVIHEQQLGEYQALEQQWQQQWQSMTSTLQQRQHEQQVKQLRLQHVIEKQQQTHAQLDKLQREQSGIDLPNLQRQLDRLLADQAIVAAELQQRQQRYQQIVIDGQELQTQLQTIEHQWLQAQNQCQAVTIEHAALAAIQRTVLLPVATETVDRWAQHPRLAEQLQVKEPWRRVCEWVLNDSLAAIVVDSITEVLPQLAQLHNHALAFVQATTPSIAVDHFPRLLEQISGVVPEWMLALQQIITANDLTEALSWLPELTSEQSIVTPNGFWIGQGWLKIFRTENQDEGILARQQQLLELEATLQQAQTTVLQWTQKREQHYQQQTENQQNQRLEHEALQVEIAAVQQLEHQMKQLQQQIAYGHMRLLALQEEQHEGLQALETALAEQLMLEKDITDYAQQIKINEQQLQQLQLEKTIWEESLTQLRQTTAAIRLEAQQMALAYQRANVEDQQLTQHFAREQQLQAQLQQRLATIHQRLDAFIAPTEQPLFAEKTKQQASLEQQLALIQQNSIVIQQQVAAAEQTGKQADLQVQALQAKQQQLALQIQTLQVRLQTTQDSLTELQQDLALCLANLASDVTVTSHEQALKTIEEKINRLGAINLLAVEEYQVELKRKQQLDNQYQDLATALTMLETAITKMDQDTKRRLAETFDQVNQTFQQLFPRLFGGGHAKLTLTCDNLLEAGIVVMAQPPGKRNSTIHLLSGGEKAMTAVALVFAIFQLNPSPFCMLDEVDAPLDDANVRRLCELIREMSTAVQFLFITHNKITMELAEHLVGVTMREPGVSRIVAVDVAAYIHEQ